ncbi:hypothetical protein [Gaetbulibacter saemankumensis]|uniref:hypothetical protein n=1 Tax=Gaetbulibacter saemankumensis TaxID=311208 RepID=UPI00041966FA|nr:hypothetical protein [Gaetbulibacter saemankumensis]
MKLLNKYSKYIPYLYFIAATAYVFTAVNKTRGITAYPILLFGIPFLWQIIKPTKKLNFTLGITFVCLSSYLLLAYLLDLFRLVPITSNSTFVGGLIVIINLLMALWIIRNSLKRSF